MFLLTFDFPKRFRDKVLNINISIYHKTERRKLARPVANEFSGQILRERLLKV